MQKTFIFLLIICATSCEYFNAKKITSESIYNEEIKMVNWNAVDTYPAFSACDTFETKEEKKTCFENTLSQHITSRLQNETIVVSQDIEDTVVLEFQISELGEITIKHIDLNETTETEIPEIKNMIANSLNTLPQVFPAIKRNQPVKTEFKLPIVIIVN
ncbi:hypothetical protein [Lacinutrix sp. Bg11-31]|uniref:hypothetical protein n=1 Tax=Lacinutrix sp. Bg11-31 TaxID=2057808 RepID=UPI000C304B82|nr:hypothetical protein [Lacinutrix sp. Bg11-31]AUC82578.1 hypothetical protein CW733_10755 [Lacinutrix sp. Bg11-31]